jgi:predicted nucleic acid-binding protein
VARLVDSSTLITLERRGGHLSTLTEIVGGEEIVLSVITASELLVGVYRASPPVRQAQREAFVSSLLTAIPIVPIDLVVARVHARLAAQLASGGRAVGAHDLLIGATAIARGASVVTENIRDFRRIPGLQVLLPEW